MQLNAGCTCPLAALKQLGQMCAANIRLERQRYLLLAGNVALRSDAELWQALRSATLLKSTSQQTFGLSGMS